MAGEPILIIDDTPVNLKLTRILLVNEGYKVTTAATAEEALSLLRNYHPQLVLTDMQLPGIDGLELTRRIKGDESTRDIAVVALSAFAAPGDEEKAREAGCDGYITKPIDTRALGARIREYLNRRAQALGIAAPRKPATPPPAPAPVPQVTIPAEEMHALRTRFLEEGQVAMRELLLSLDGQFNAVDAGKRVHTWIGTGGLLGYPSITKLARQVEDQLRERPLESSDLRDSLQSLAEAFNTPMEAVEAPIPESLIQSLSGKRVALIGIPPGDAQRLCQVLERARAKPLILEIDEQPNSPMVENCQLALVGVSPETADSAWLDPARIPATSRVVYVGSLDRLLSLNPDAHSLAGEFLMDAWQPEEALVRMSLALSRRPSHAPPSVPSPQPHPVRASVLVADDDPTMLAMVRTTLENFGMECYPAGDGPAALIAARTHRPNGAVLDVNMPGMDGYEVLAAIRKEEIPMRVLLLTARQQEADVLRGFRLGADDYMVKPFSPMELVARMKRLFGR
jgi:two-component system, cell cycle response regulator DivK